MMLITGDGAGGERPGQGGSLDPSGAPLVDLLPVHNAAGTETWTWKNDMDRYPPYALDRIIYSGSLLVAARSFVLDTTIMNDAERLASGLQPGDVTLDLAAGHFDHLPVVADFTFR